MSSYHRVASVKDLAAGSGMAVQVGEHSVALFNVGGTFYAIGEACPHRGGPLSEGSIEGNTVTCPLHGASFDLTSGKNLTPPAATGVPCYRVRVEGDEVQIEIP